MYTKVILSHPIFFEERAGCNFGKIVVILRVARTISSSTEKSLRALRRPKTNLRSTMGQDHLSHLVLLYIERAFVNRLNFQSILDEKALVIYFGSCKKVN